MRILAIVEDGRQYQYMNDEVESIHRLTLEDGRKNNREILRRTEYNSKEKWDAIEVFETGRDNQKVNE